MRLIVLTQNEIYLAEKEQIEEQPSQEIPETPKTEKYASVKLGPKVMQEIDNG